MIRYMNNFNRKPAFTVTELASARQHQKNWPAVMERAVEGGWTGSLPRVRFLSRRQRGRLRVDCTEREGRGRAFHRTNFLLHAREQQHRLPGSARWEGGEGGDWGRREGEGVAHKQQWMVHPLSIVPTAHGWTGLGPEPPRRAWAIGGGDASPASVRLRARGAPVAATPSFCGTGSTAGDGTSTLMESVSPPVSAAGGSPGAGVVVGAPSDGTDGGAPFVFELVDLDAATAASAAWRSAAL